MLKTDRLITRQVYAVRPDDTLMRATQLRHWQPAGPKRGTTADRCAFTIGV